jgi:hypothetical protein
MAINLYFEMESLVWRNLWRSSGHPMAVYRYNDIERSVKIVPTQPTPDSLGFEDFHLYKTIRIFIVGMEELNGTIPKEGDTITYNNTVYTVKKTPNTPCYENIGNYGVMLRIYTSIYRS